jgi:hypothetical protein
MVRQYSQAVVEQIPIKLDHPQSVGNLPRSHRMRRSSARAYRRCRRKFCASSAPTPERISVDIALDDRQMMNNYFYISYEPQLTSGLAILLQKPCQVSQNQSSDRYHRSILSPLRPTLAQLNSLKTPTNTPQPHTKKQRSPRHPLRRLVEGALKLLLVLPMR